MSVALTISVAAVALEAAVIVCLVIKLRRSAEE